MIINNNSELLLESVEKSEKNALEPVEPVEAAEDDMLVTNLSDIDNQISESNETKARDWPDLEFNIAYALWEGEIHWEFISLEV